MTELKTCTCCGQVIIHGDTFEYDGEIFCEDCFHDNFAICECCNEIIPFEDSYCFQDTVFCSWCYSERVITCVDCGENVWRDDATYTVDGYVCEGCLLDDYIECVDCGEIVHYDGALNIDDEWYCSDCADNHKGAIHDYGYKPLPYFYGENDALFMGIELEIDGGGENSGNAEKLINLDGNDHFYCKHDGSLSEGFEIVSHPCTLDYHMNEIRWADIMHEAICMGYTSHDANTCGLHIHVSRNGLGNSDFDIDQTIANILFFVERYWDRLVKFTRRTEYQLERWADRYGNEDTPHKLHDKAKKQRERYRAINLLPLNTIEFRLFRGTLKYSTFIATLQFVHALCNFCRGLAPGEITTLTWEDFTTSVEGNYTELENYMKSKNIWEVL